MKNKLTHVAMFVAGASIGAGAVCLYLKKKFERIYDERFTYANDMLLELINKYHTTNTEEGSEILNEE